MITFSQLIEFPNFLRSCVSWPKLSFFLSLGILSTGSIMGQDEMMPRTQYGHPDFQGTYSILYLVPKEYLLMI